MIITQTTGNLGDQVTISGSGNTFFRISDVRVGGFYASGITGWQPTGLASGASGDPTGNAVYGALNILKSGTSASFEVINTNTIQVDIPSVNSISGVDNINKWAASAYPAPITVISESRNITGYASGSSGQSFNFRPIPVIDKLSPLSGISGEKAYVEGDGFLGVSGLKLVNLTGFSQVYVSGFEKIYGELTGIAEVTGYVTGVTGYTSIVTGYVPTGVVSGMPTGIPVTGTYPVTEQIPVTGYVWNTGNYYIWQNPTGVYEDLKGNLTVYLPFETINNTGITFELPSGNFYGQVQLCVSGESGEGLIESKPSNEKISPEVEITGFWPQIGFSGEGLTISGRYFLPELLSSDSYEVAMATGGSGYQNGYIVVFEGDATGFFASKSGNKYTEITGLIPGGASTGPVRIKQNTNIAGSDIGYYVSDAIFPIYRPAASVSSIQGLDNTSVPVGPISLIETGNLPTFNITGDGITNRNTGTAFSSVGQVYKELFITGFLTSGFSGRVSGITGYINGYQSGFTGICVTGVVGQTGSGDQAGWGITGSVSGACETSGINILIPVTGITISGVMTGITFTSGFNVEVGAFSSNSTIAFAVTESKAGYQPINLRASNYYSSGTQTGSAERFEGVEKSPISIYYPSLGPDLEDCLTDYQFKSERGDNPVYYLSGCEQAFLLYYSGSYASFDIGGSELQPALLEHFVSTQGIASGLAGNTDVSGINPSLTAAEIALAKTSILASTYEEFDQYTNQIPVGVGETGHNPPPDVTDGPIEQSPPNPWGGVPKPPPPYNPPLLTGEWPPGYTPPTYCGYKPPTEAYVPIEAPVARPYESYVPGGGLTPFTRETVSATSYYTFQPGWAQAIFFHNGHTFRPGRNGGGYNALNLSTRWSPGIRSPYGRVTFLPGTRGGALSTNPRRLIETPKPGGTNTRIDCDGTRPTVNQPPKPTAPLQPQIPKPVGNPPGLLNPIDPCEEQGNPITPLTNPNGEPKSFIPECNVGMPVYRPGDSIPIPMIGEINQEETSPYQLNFPVENTNNTGAGEVNQISQNLPVVGFGTEECPESKPPLVHPKPLIPTTPFPQGPRNPENSPGFPVIIGPCPAPPPVTVPSGPGAPPPIINVPPWTPVPPITPLPLPRGPWIECGGPVYASGIQASGLSTIVSGFWIVNYPTIDSCSTNNCYSHALTTGSSGYHLYDQNLIVGKDTIAQGWAPFPVVNNNTAEFSKIFYGASGEPIIEALGETGTPVANFEVENSGALKLKGGYIQSEPSSGFNFVNQDEWTVQFWINHFDFHQDLEFSSYNTKDVVLFGLSGELPSEKGNTYFHLGYERHSGAGGITNTIKPYADLSGISTLYQDNLSTGWFPETGTYRHFAFVKNTTGYSLHYDGCQKGVSIEATGIDKYLPSGKVKFYFGGLSTGKYVDFNTGWNQYQAPISTTDFQLNLENNLDDTGKYKQIVSSGGALSFETGNARIGTASLCMDGSSFLQTTGSNFNYGTGNFTVECFAYPSGASQGVGTMGNTVQTLWMIGQTSMLNGSNYDFSTGNGVALLLNHNTNRLRLLFDYDNQYLCHDLVPPYNNSVLRTKEWNHIAICRSGTVFYSYINGNPAGAVTTEDFSGNYNTKGIYTGMPVIQATGQNLYIGGALSGAIATNTIVDTGVLYESQPYKYELLVSTISGFVTTGFASGITGGAVGTIIDDHLSGYEYTVKTDGTLYANADVTAYWGGKVSDEIDYGTILCQWIYNRDGSSEKSMIEQSFNVGGRITDTSLGFNKNNSLRQKMAAPSKKPKYGIYSESDYFPMYNPDGTSRIFNVQTLSVEITGLKSGDKVKFFAPRYNNALPAQPYDMELSRNNNWLLENNQYNQLFINSLQFQESKLNNYCGLIDQFIVSDECKYSSIPATGSFESGYLDTDLGKEVYVKELNVRRDAIFAPDNGKYSEPTTAPVSGSGTASILNFETSIDLSNIITNGITGDSQHGKTYKTNSGVLNAAFSASGEGKYNNYAMNFPTGNTVPNTGGNLFTENVSIGTGDFTVEMWVKPSGTAYLTSRGLTVNDDLKRQVLLSFGTTGSGFNFFISGGQNGNHIGLDLYNGGRVSGFESVEISLESGYTTPGDLQRLYILGGSDLESSGSYYSSWTSGDWNHIAFVRQEMNVMAYMNGYFAGMVNWLGNDTAGPAAYSNSNYIDRAAMIVAPDEGGAGVNIGDLNITDSLLTLGGGSLETPNFEGQIDAFNFITGVTGAKYTNIFQAPRPWVTCDKDNELVSHFSEPNNFWNFHDDHCCATGTRGDAHDAEWGDIVTIKGKDFFGVTGVLLGNASSIGSGNQTLIYQNAVSEWRVVDPSTIQFVIPPDSNGYDGISIVGNTTKQRTNTVTSGIDYDGDGRIDKVTNYERIVDTTGARFHKHFGGCRLNISAPPIDIIDFSPISGYANENIVVRGESLHLTETLMISGSENNRLELPFTGIGSTGLRFAVPALGNMETYIQVFSQNSGDISSDKLRILTSGIKYFSPKSGVYNEEIIFSGNFFENQVDIPLFPCYQVGDVESPSYNQQTFVPALSITYIDETGIHAKIPKGIVKGYPILSGSGNGLVISGSEKFTPIPTIEGIEKTITKVGCSFRITGTNASDLVPLLGFTGSSLQPYTAGDAVVEFVANTGDTSAERANTFPVTSDFGIDRNNSGIYSSIFYFGKFEMDKTHLEANLPTSAQTGYVIISGTLNNQIVGNGNPFLISRHEVFNAENGNVFNNYYDTSGLNIDLLRSDFVNRKETYALQNLGKVTGDQMIISGRTPFVTGITPTRGDGGIILEVSGLYGLNVTGVKFVPVSDPSVECHMNSGEFIKQKTTINSLDAISSSTTTTVITGWHFANRYTGDGQYIDVGDQVQVYQIYPCEQLRNYGEVDILLMYDSGISTTGLC